MPNIKSQKDRVRQTKIETMRNKAVKSNMKTVLKKANAATASEEDIRVAVATVSSAANKGVIHKNKAARKMSQLMRKA